MQCVRDFLLRRGSENYGSTSGGKCESIVHVYIYIYRYIYIYIYVSICIYVTHM